MAQLRVFATRGRYLNSFCIIIRYNILVNNSILTAASRGDNYVIDQPQANAKASQSVLNGNMSDLYGTEGCQGKPPAVQVHDNHIDINMGKSIRSKVKKSFRTKKRHEQIIPRNERLQRRTLKTLQRSLALPKLGLAGLTEGFSTAVDIIIVLVIDMEPFCICKREVICLRSCTYRYTGIGYDPYSTRCLNLARTPYSTEYRYISAVRDAILQVLYLYPVLVLTTRLLVPYEYTTVTEYCTRTGIWSSVVLVRRTRTPYCTCTVRRDRTGIYSMYCIPVLYNVPVRRTGTESTYSLLVIQVLVQ